MRIRRSRRVGGGGSQTGSQQGGGEILRSLKVELRGFEISPEQRGERFSLWISEIRGVSGVQDTGAGEGDRRCLEVQWCRNHVGVGPGSGFVFSCFSGGLGRSVKFNPIIYFN